MKEFKNCLCCGSSSVYLTFEVNDIGTVIPIMFCNSCKIIFKVENDSPYLNDKETYKYLEEKTIKAWNTRKPFERVIERLEEEERLADEEKERCDIANPLQFDSAKGYSNGMYNAIEIIKQEMM